MYDNDRDKKTITMHATLNFEYCISNSLILYVLFKWHIITKIKPSSSDDFGAKINEKELRIFTSLLNYFTCVR